MGAPSIPKKRRRARLIVLSLILMLGIAGVKITARSNWAIERRIQGLSIRSRDLTAAHAHREFQKLLGAIGGYPEKHSEGFPIVELYELHAQVAWKCLIEGDYRNSFELYVSIPGVMKSGMRPLVIYVAGLAGRSEWLSNQMQECEDDHLELLRLFCEANLCWTKNDDTRIVLLTDPQNVNRLFDRAVGLGLMGAWIPLMRAKAYQRVGQNELAWQALEGLAGDAEAAKKNWMFCIIFWNTLGDIAEKTGRTENALGMAEAALSFLKKFGADRSAAALHAQIEERIRRLSSKQLAPR